MSIIHPLDELMKTVRKGAYKILKKETKNRKTELVCLNLNGDIYQPSNVPWKRNANPQELLCRKVVVDTWSDWKKQEITLPPIVLGLHMNLAFKYRVLIPGEMAETTIEVIGRAKAGATLDTFIKKNILSLDKKHSQKRDPDFKEYGATILNDLRTEVEKVFKIKLDWSLEIESSQFQALMHDVQYELNIFPNDYPIPLPVRLEVKIFPETRKRDTFTAVEFDHETLARELGHTIGEYFQVRPVSDLIANVFESDKGISHLIGEKLKWIGCTLVQIKIGFKGKYHTLISEGWANAVQVEVKRMSWGKPVRLSLAYKVEVVPDKMHQTLKSLAHEAPQNDLEAKMRNAIADLGDELSGTRSNFFLNFDTHQDAFQEAVKKDLSLHHGLRLRGVLTLVDEEDAIHGLEVHQEKITVQVKDLPRDLLLSVNIGIERIPGQKRKAMAAGLNKAGKKALLRSTVRQTCLAEISLHELYLDLISAQTKIKESIEAKFLECGFRLTRFSISTKTSLDFEVDPPQFDYEQEFRPPGASRGINFKSSVILRLKNLADYIRQDITNFHAWVEKVVIDETSEVAFEKTNSELILESASIVEKIKNNIRDTFSDAGYTVLLHVVEPDNEYGELQRGFVIKSKKNNYTTKNNESEVALDINIRGEIRDLGAIEEYLKRKNFPINAFKEMLESVAEDAVSAVLEEVHAEHFYFYFERPFHRPYEKPPFPPETLLKSHLETALRKALTPDDDQKSYGIENLRITLQQNETKIIRRYNKLQSQSHDFEFTLHPPGKPDPTEIVTIKAGFGIKFVSPEHWHIYKQKCKHNDHNSEEYEQKLQELTSKNADHAKIFEVKRQLEKANGEGARRQIKEIITLMEEKTRDFLEDYDPIELRNLAPEDSINLKNGLKNELVRFLMPRVGLIIEFAYFRYKNFSEDSDYSEMLEDVKREEIKEGGKKRKDDIGMRRKIMKRLRKKIEDKYSMKELDEEDLEELKAMEKQYADLSKSDFVSPQKSLSIGGEKPETMKRHSPMNLLNRFETDNPAPPKIKLEKGDKRDNPKK